MSRFESCRRRHPPSGTRCAPISSGSHDARRRWGSLASAPSATKLAPVAQGIEHRPPEAGAKVRLLPGALLFPWSSTSDSCPPNMRMSRRGPERVTPPRATFACLVRAPRRDPVLHPVPLRLLRCGSRCGGTSLVEVLTHTLVGRGETGRARVNRRQFEVRVRSQRMARRRDVRALPEGPRQRRQGLVGLLRQGPARTAAPPRPPRRRPRTARRAPATARSRSRPARPRAAPPAVEERARPRASPSAKKSEPERRAETGRRRPSQRRPRSPTRSQDQRPRLARRARQRAPASRPPRRPRRSARPRPTDEPTYTVLKGAPARTVANMDASLTVPDRDQRARRSRSSCCGTTASSSTTTSPAPAAARCPSPT